MSKVGFIGLGIMGTPMAGHLVAAGHEVHLHSRSGVPASLTDAGGMACASAAEVARRADVIITMVPDTPDVAAVLFAPGGVAEGLSPGKVVVDMSSISPVETKAFARGSRRQAATTSTRRCLAARWARRRRRSRSWPAGRRRRSTACGRCSS
jgi:2-hydroxy-3-oxopropionate reductase